ncbi:MAG: type II toxin-antitoxin system HicB family antitoxin [Oscillospiraceae bacterium]|jgi:predicted RNase H-like HicB family nuclease|nr:type II toxin-antitoxin system HicB family antitoxin [Oscillospiraceae bacterium]
MYNYEIILYWSRDDNAYVAEVPELPGCMADGATANAALQNAQKIMQEWLDTARELGRTIPQAHGRLKYA